MPNRREFLKDLTSVAAGIFFVGCDLLDAVAAPTQSGGARRRREVTVGGRRVRTVDVHGHCYIPEAWDLIQDHEKNNPLNTPVGPLLNPTNIELRLKEMDEKGIDVQAVSLPPFYTYWAERDLARRIVELQNEKIAELCAAHPDRLAGLGGLSLQHPDLAVEQMDSGIKKLGLRGFEINGSVNGEELSAPKFHPFWAKAEELGCLIFIHPNGFREGERRFQGNGLLTNVIGNPLETTVALSHLIFEGTLDRFPGVKICAAHGGGYLASYIGRSDHCVKNSGHHPANCKALQKLPSEYLKQLYFDCLVFTAEGLRHLVAEAGAGQIVLGTDYPFGMGTTDVVDLVLSVPGLSNAQREAILGGNAARLLRIRA